MTPRRDVTELFRGYSESERTFSSFDFAMATRYSLFQAGREDAEVRLVARRLHVSHGKPLETRLREVHLRLVEGRGEREGSETI